MIPILDHNVSNFGFSGSTGKCCNFNILFRIFSGQESPKKYKLWEQAVIFIGIHALSPRKFWKLSFLELNIIK